MAKDRSESPRHRRLQGRADHRDSGQAGRGRQGRSVAGDARVRQGDHGRACARRRDGARHRRQGRRQGLDGLVDPEARRGRRRSGATPAPAKAPAQQPTAAAASAPTAAPSHRRSRAGEDRRPGALPIFPGVIAGPAVRRLARELDLDLTQVRGTGEKGRITREDVKAALAAAAAVRAARRCPKSRQSISPSSGRSRPSRCRASSASPARGCTPRGSTFPMSPTATKPTSPSSRRSARALDDDGQGRQEGALSRFAAAAADEGLGRDAQGVSDVQRFADAQPRTR